MKIRLLSDLHLEFFPFKMPALESDKESVLVLAGDIAPIEHKHTLRHFLVCASRQFRHVIFVAGNHEFYGGIWPQSLSKVRTWGLPANVHILERSTITIDDVVFLGATLWTDMDGADPMAMLAAQGAMGDYRAIRVVEGNDCRSRFARLRPEKTVADHYRSRAWIKRELKRAREKNLKAVLVTHHGLTPQSIHEIYHGNMLNPAFCSDLTSLLEEYQPCCAFHGHTHSSFDYRLGGECGTRVVVNPRGYTRRDDTQENPDFDPTLVIEI